MCNCHGVSLASRANLWRLALTAALAATGSTRTQAADKAAIAESMQKGVRHIISVFGTIKDEGDQALAALALLKCGHPESSAEIQGVAAEIIKRCADDKYAGGQHHIYLAGVDATFLADLDSQKYAPQIKIISTYLQSLQLPNGGWDYPTGRQGIGDTSVVQYACLGLWAAERAGQPVPQQVWENAIRWHAATQLDDGGFTYIPTTTTGAWNGLSSLNMTAAAVGSLMICARHAFPGRADDLAELLMSPKAEVRPKTAEENAGESTLVKVDLSKTQTTEAPAEETPQLDINVARDTVRRAVGWVEPRTSPCDFRSLATRLRTGRCITCIPPSVWPR